MIMGDGEGICPRWLVICPSYVVWQASLQCVCEPQSGAVRSRNFRVGLYCGPLVVH